MTKLKKTIVPLLLCALLGSTAVLATGDSFDSSVDPLVSLSYINEVVIPDLEAQIHEAKAIAEANSDKASKSELQAVANRVSSLEKQMANIQASVESILESLNDEENKPMSAAYDIVYMKYGQKIFSQKHSFEIILRTGEAEVISPFSYENGSEHVQGIADITSGTDVTDGSAIERNHMLVVPSGGDGRGVLITSEDAYLLVRGEYYIVE